MSGFIPDNLKDSINREYVNKFPFEKLKEEMFIPINKQDDVLYVGIVDAENREKRNAILTKVILTTKLKPKVVTLTKEQFDDLIHSLEEKYPEPEKEADEWDRQPIGLGRMSDLPDFSNEAASQFSSKVPDESPDEAPDETHNEVSNETFSEVSEKVSEIIPEKASDEKIPEETDILKEEEGELIHVDISLIDDEDTTENTIENTTEDIREDVTEDIIEDNSHKEEIILTKENNMDLDEEPIVNKAEDSSENKPVTESKPQQPQGPKKRLGEQLIDDGLITKDQLDVALKESKMTGTPIGSVLVKLGYITINQLRTALSRQQGYAFVESKDLKIDPSVIRLLPEDFIRDNKVVPISTDGKSIVLGMVNPNNKQVLNDIIYLTGLKPSPLILTHIEYEKSVDSFFETKKETEKLMEEISSDDNIVVMEENLWQQVEKEIEDDTNIVAKFASSVVTEAIEKGASDVHIEPYANKYVIRYRIDGILRHALDVPSKIETMLVSRLKVISRMDIAEHRRPQDGIFTLKYDGRIFNLRLSTLPVGQKEKMVIRILRPDLKVSSNKDKKIELVGARSQDIEKIDIMTTSPHGIILVTGPTGSGKTTTLYSILNKVNDPMVNITTIEDPVEINLEGVNQVQVNPKADVTFESCMRAILRQDPDIIMIGEIRDTETLDAAIYASLTGHLVLSSLHTNSAVATVTRLIKMGAAPYLIASSLVGVIAQRLVRRLCPSCKEIYEPKKEELKLIVSNSEDYDLFMNNKVYKSVGCNECGETGFVGRMGIYEIMPINRELQKVITNSVVTHEIEETAIACGMRTLQRSGLDAVLNGNISIKEYIRVLGANND